jgi:hypothetical protein
MKRPRLGTQADFILSVASEDSAQNYARNHEEPAVSPAVEDGLRRSRAGALAVSDFHHAHRSFHLVNCYLSCSLVDEGDTNDGDLAAQPGRHYRPERLAAETDTKIL